MIGTYHSVFFSILSLFCCFKRKSHATIECSVLGRLQFNIKVAGAVYMDFVSPGSSTGSPLYSKDFQKIRDWSGMECYT